MRPFCSPICSRVEEELLHLMILRNQLLRQIHQVPPGFGQILVIALEGEQAASCAALRL